MSAERVYFCGAIAGSVVLRKGETPEDALDRAEEAILSLLDRRCKRLQVNIGLESDASGRPS